MAQTIPVGSSSSEREDPDHDDFDWEAALEEIDSVVEKKTHSASKQEAIFRPLGERPPARAFPNPAKNNGKARQITLDRFVGSRCKNGDAGRRSFSEEKSPVHPGGGDGGPVSGHEHEDSGVHIDLEAAKTWIYPVNVPRRDYQFSITKCSLFSNTLVALPTGLGKTLIAAVVMYNYFRWFPKGKIVFAAPSRPLVMQQIEACHNIVGISQKWTIDMTGQMSPTKRMSFWETKRVFFVTPQVLERDIQSGICLIKQLVCLVIDEAHRALGNYSYCVAVRELMAVSVKLRILALTATPGSKHDTIQSIINNLCITTLEYRCESDPDVMPYVHNRKLELLKIPLLDAAGIDDMLLKAMRKFVSQLCGAGVLLNRDLATMSPCELLDSREKFRQSPPVNLPHARHGEIEGYFSVLITIHHIRKLLLSHGITPAYEMLEDKLHKGASSVLMYRNFNILEARRLMRESLSSGAANPKLVKMTEILVDHFKTHESKQSRVIIFSNFRGSIKEILNSLGSIGDLVKATEFIGQSSGKSLKGQNQKMQQAVLQKFRNGVYNVIVATSIGEEGLDIMEVDLVICFDCNISPLRMIQRMGRTGRKHDGRVVVLGYEGSEVNGYLKKQAKNKAITKHMHNGGIKSFDFHPSPRMVPHACKPEVRFVELSIEEYIPRGKKTTDDVASACQSTFLEKITDEGKNLLARYFQPSEENRWRPSLIAFPHFQAFPSGVHELRHSFRTATILIDAMQNLRGFYEAKKVKSSPRLLCTPFASDNDEKDKKATKVLFDDKFPSEETSCINPSCSDYELYAPDPSIQKSLVHNFLFGQGFVSVSASGHVKVSTAPALPNKWNTVFNGTSTQSVKGILGNSTEVVSKSQLPDMLIGGSILPSKVSEEATNSIESKHMDDEEVFLSQLPRDGMHEDQVPCGLQNARCKADDVNSEDVVAHTPDGGGSKCNTEDAEFSPRLAHFIVAGVVPESPADETSPNSFKCDVKETNFVKQCDKSTVLRRLPSSMTETLPCLERLKCNESGYLRELFDVSLDTEKCTSLLPSKNLGMDITPEGKAQMTNSEIERKRKISGYCLDKGLVTPIANFSSNSCTVEWQLNSQSPPQSLVHLPKLKRLRRCRDISRKLPCAFLNGNPNFLVDVDGPTSNANSRVEKSAIGSKRMKLAHSFVDEEAEVSNDAVVSADEKDDGNDDEYDDSFIDDRATPSEATQGEKCTDMIGFYRRSLLTQSPLVWPQCVGTLPLVSISPCKAGVGSCSPRTISSCRKTPEGVNSVTHRLSSYIPTRVGDGVQPYTENSSMLGSKRKLIFKNGTSSIHSTIPQMEVAALHGTSREDGEISDKLYDDDDEFYRSIDFEAIERQAALLVRSQCNPPAVQDQVVAQKNLMEPELGMPRSSLEHPTFDLGI